MQRMNELLDQLITGKLTAEQGARLKQTLSRTTDDELGEALSELWEQYEGQAAPGDRQEDILRMLAPAPEKPRRGFRPLRAFVRVAAVILVCIATGMYWHTSSENKKLNSFLAEKITVDIKSGEKADLAFPDGSEASLNAGTTLTYPSNFGYAKRDLSLEGEAYFDVAKDPTKPLRIHTRSVTVEVLGTRFNLCSYDGEDITELTLIEGSVKMTTRSARPQTIILQPNQKAIYHKRADMILVENTTTRFETAWLRGELVLRSARFSDIITKLERRYGVEISVGGVRQPTDKDLFTGSFNQKQVGDVLKILQTNYNFTYQQQDGRIRIYFQ